MPYSINFPIQEFLSLISSKRFSEKKYRAIIINKVSENLRKYFTPL
jgi:hypothetical protein